MPIKKKKDWGKGLDSLIPDNKSMKSVTSEKTVESKEKMQQLNPVYR